MAEPYLNTRGAVLVEVEGSYGVDPTLVAADAIAVPMGKKVINWKGSMKDRKILRPSTLPLLPAVASYHCEVELEGEFKAGGTAGTACNLGDVLQACGLKQTDGVSDVTYNLDITDGKSIYVGEYVGAQLHVASGVRCNELVIKGKAGEPVTYSAKGKGMYVAPTDSAIISSPVYDTTPPIILGITGGSFAFNGYSWKVREFEISIKTTMAERAAGYGTAPFLGFVLTAYESISIKFKAEAPSVADQGVVANWISGDNAALDITLGGTSGNKWDIDCPRMVISAEPKWSEDGGISMFEVEAVASESTDNALNDGFVLKEY